MPDSLGPSQPVPCTSILRLPTSNRSRPTGAWRFRSRVAPWWSFQYPERSVSDASRVNTKSWHRWCPWYVLIELHFISHHLHYGANIFRCPHYVHAFVKQIGAKCQNAKNATPISLFLHIRFFGLWSSLLRFLHFFPDGPLQDPPPFLSNLSLPENTHDEYLLKQTKIQEWLIENWQSGIYWIFAWFICTIVRYFIYCTIVHYPRVGVIKIHSLSKF